jgi:hypothetical protein
LWPKGQGENPEALEFRSKFGSGPQLPIQMKDHNVGVWNAIRQMKTLALSDCIGEEFRVLVILIQSIHLFFQAIQGACS